MKIALLICLGILPLSATVLAQDCKHPNDVMESKTCAESRFAEVDARLSQAFETIVADIAKRGPNPPPIHLDNQLEHRLKSEKRTAQRKLVASENAWKQYREATCSAVETLV